MSYDLYTPGLVPQGGTLEQTQRYLDEELQRIQSAIRLTTVQPAFGCLEIEAAVVVGANIAPQVVAPWDTALPAEPARTTVDAVNGEITILENGVYLVIMSMSLVGDSGVVYYLTLYKNGSPTVVQCVQPMPAALTDLSVFHTQIDLDAGDVLSLRVNTAATNGATFTPQRAHFSAQRVSEFVR